MSHRETFSNMWNIEDESADRHIPSDGAVSRRRILTGLGLLAGAGTAGALVASQQDSNASASPLIATALSTNSGSVDVSGAAPPANGQVLTATGPTQATWQDASSVVAPSITVIPRAGLTQTLQWSAAGPWFDITLSSAVNPCALTIPPPAGQSPGAAGGVGAELLTIIRQPPGAGGAKVLLPANVTSIGALPSLSYVAGGIDIWRWYWDNADQQWIVDGVLGASNSIDPASTRDPVAVYEARSIDSFADGASGIGSIPDRSGTNSPLINASPRATWHRFGFNPGANLGPGQSARPYWSYIAAPGSSGGVTLGAGRKFAPDQGWAIIVAYRCDTANAEAAIVTVRVDSGRLALQIKSGGGYWFDGQFHNAVGGAFGTYGTPAVATLAYTPEAVRGSRYVIRQNTVDVTPTGSGGAGFTVSGFDLGAPQASMSYSGAVMLGGFDLVEIERVERWLGYYAGLF